MSAIITSTKSVTNDALIKRFVELGKILEESGDGSPEEKIAEFLISIGLIERYNGSFRLTEAGEKFLKRSEEE